MRYVDELTEAIRSQLALAYGLKDQLGFGLRQRLREGYTAADFKADLRAGIAVGAVALPLSMALAVASEVPPQLGLYTAIVAGLLCALLGGTRVQVTGPTAALVVILIPVVREHGVAGLLCAGMMSGAILVAMGLARMGKLMTFIPHPVTTGFTAGIAVVLALLQLEDVFGLDVGKPSGTIAYLGALWQHRGDAHLWDAAIAVATVILLLVVPRFVKRIPAAVIVLGGVAAVAALVHHLLPSFDVATIGSRFETTVGGEVVRGIPQLPPMPVLPWHGGPASFALDWVTIKTLLPAAFAIAMLGAIESLTAAVIADGLTGSKHDPNSELIALGIANVVTPFFGGIAATGALTRTATNIKLGARSPLAAVVAATFVLACTIALAPLLAYLPIAALAGLLLVMARNMAESRHVARLLKIAPRSDVLVLITCFTLTVLFDMVIAVTVGVMLAALLFMRRMAVMTQIKLDTTSQQSHDMPAGIELYEIAGPLFFGAAKTAMETLDAVGSDAQTVILHMKQVAVLDSTGMVALESMLDRLHRSNRKVIVAGLPAEPGEMLARFGIKRVPGRLAFAPDVETALSMAIVHAARAPTNPGAGNAPVPVV